MKMTIDEALDTIKGNRWIACAEKYHEAMEVIENTISKYQKIKKIIEPLKQFSLDEMSTIEYEILEVMEDGNNK